MRKFSEWLTLREGFVRPNIGQGFEALSQFWQQYRNATVQFQDDMGQTHTGRLIDLLDEGVFLVQDEQGQEHDVSPQQIMGVQQSGIQQVGQQGVQQNV